MENQSGVIQMQSSTPGEVIHLFEVMQEHAVPCTLEFNSQHTLDPLFDICGQAVSNVEYIERSGGPDCVLIGLGELEMGFDLGLHEFSKFISDCQISICIADVLTGNMAWFNSGVMSPEAIEEAKAYVEPSFEDMDEKSNDITLTEQERSLILTIRGLCFADILDANAGIEAEAEKAMNKCNARLAAGDKFNAEGFRTRSINLKHLAHELGYANADYRDHIYPDGLEE